MHRLNVFSPVFLVFWLQLFLKCSVDETILLFCVAAGEWSFHYCWRLFVRGDVTFLKSVKCVIIFIWNSFSIFYACLIHLSHSLIFLLSVPLHSCESNMPLLPYSQTFVSFPVSRTINWTKRISFCVLFFFLYFWKILPLAN